MGLAAVLLAGAGVAVVERAIRDSCFGAVLVLLAVLGQVVMFDVPAQFPLGSFTVHLLDLVAGVLLVATVARYLRTERFSMGQILLVGFGMMTMISIVAGLAEFPIQLVLNEARRYVYFVSVGLYFSTMDARPEVLDRLARLLLAAAGVLVATAVLRWAVLPLGLQGGLFGPGGMRVLWAGEALFLLQALFIALIAWRRGGSAWWARAAIALLVVIVLLQHRTVWIALIVSGMVIVLRDRLLARRLAVLALGAVLVGGLFVLVVFGDTQEVTAELGQSVQDEGTFRWRYLGWAALLEGGGVDTPIEALHGQPFGTGWERMLRGQLIVVSPHNFYIESYLRVGLVGLTLLVLLYGHVLRRLLASPRETTDLPPAVLVLILVSQLVYYVAYTPSAVDALMVGVAIAVTSSRDRLRRPSDTRVEPS